MRIFVVVFVVFLAVVALFVPTWLRYLFRDRIYRHPPIPLDDARRRAQLRSLAEDYRDSAKRRVH